MKTLFNRLLPIGRRSLLFGVHQFAWHPFTVFLAWIKLYGWPSWKEIICIIVHDWGYWQCRDMDGEDGERHAEVGCYIAYKLFGQKYAELCLLHSRHYAKAIGAEPSRLCYADKLSIMYEPWWFYLARAWLTGELWEYRAMAAQSGYVSLSASHREWFKWVQSYLSSKGKVRHDTYLPG